MKHKEKIDDEIRAEYEFDYSKAARGKYSKIVFAKGSNVILLDPDVAKVFRDSASVNEALRSVLAMAQTTERLKKQTKPRSPRSAAK